MSRKLQNSSRGSSAQASASSRGSQGNLHRKLFLGLLLLSLLPLFPAQDLAQVSTASINGVVRDSSGAVISNAAVVLRNVDTTVENTTITNKSGVYSIFSITPGRYTLRISATGFSSKQVDMFPLAVSQIATFDFTLEVGSQSSVVIVQGSSAQLNTSSASLGTVIGTQQANDLPLNGRSFTELLTLTPGVSAINTAQNAGGGFATPTVVTSDVVIPAINGQGNRSNFFLADGMNDFDNIVSTYAIPPIIDAIQEFTVVSHTDSAEYGGVLGGVINVTTKSGTSVLHGSAWEYARNAIFDARSYFLPTDVAKTPYSQNQFGGSIGGPVRIPKLYDGRSNTFFFAAYQGFRFSQITNAPLHVPTTAELSGDESDWPTQIYNPFTTRADPANPGQFIADPFPGNQIPANLIQKSLVSYAQFEYPQAGPVFDSSGDNALDTTPFTQTQNEWNIRVDQKIGTNDSAFFRYSAINSVESASGGLPGTPSPSSLPGRDWGGSYVHVFSPSLILQGQFARIESLQGAQTFFTKSISAIQSALNFSPTFGSGWSYPGLNMLPGLFIGGYSNAGENISSNTSNDGYEYGAHLTKTLGDHTLQFGGEYTTSHFDSHNSNSGESFTAQNTGDPNPQDTVNAGSPMASFLLGIPNSASRQSDILTTRPGGEANAFAQDSWKLLPRLTLNFGLRYDLTLIPPLGRDGLTAYHGGPYIGDMNFADGTYILQKLPPACNVAQVAPCIPGNGVLPAHVVVSPTGKIAHNIHDNYGPRVGFAYQVSNQTVIRGAFGMLYDNWAGINQMVQNLGGDWPDIGGRNVYNLNLPSTESPTPTLPYNDPFGAGVSAGNLPGPSPFNQGNYFYDPNRKNPRSYQFNLGGARLLNSTTSVTLNYVGMVSYRLDVGGPYNTAITPGPGDPQTRSLYPYINPAFYDRSTGASSYHGLQLSLNKRYTDGWSYSVAYTWSKTMDDGTDGFFGAEGGVPQDPYSPSSYGSRSVAGYDVPNNLAISLLYQSPFGVGKRFSSGNGVVNYILGNWQINNIFTAYSGLPFTPVVSSDIANTGNGAVYETLDVVGNPHQIAKPGPAEWFNTAAYAVPPGFTYGTAGRNSLRSAGFRNLDTSLFRQVPIGGERQFEFRIEAFNLMNEVVLGEPFSDKNDGSLFGTINGTANTAREVQLALKFAF